jgi:hypothetical protein
MAVYGQMIEKRLNFGCAHFVWMSLTVKQYEVSCPVTIGGFGISTEMSTTANDGKLIKQAWEIG